MKRLKANECQELVRKLTTLHKFCKAKNLLIQQSCLKYDKTNQEHEKLLLKVRFYQSALIEADLIQLWEEMKPEKRLSERVTKEW